MIYGGYKFISLNCTVKHTAPDVHHLFLSLTQKTKITAKQNVLSQLVTWKIMNNKRRNLHWMAPDEFFYLVDKKIFFK